jgi:hypothetical protein
VISLTNWHFALPELAQVALTDFAKQKIPMDGPSCFFPKLETKLLVNL